MRKYILVLLLSICCSLLAIFNENRLVLHQWGRACPRIVTLSILVLNYFLFILVVEAFIALFLIFLVDVLHLIASVRIQSSYILDVRV